MAVVLNGRETSDAIMEELAAKVEELKGKGVTPNLGLVLTGTDKYSRRYVRMKAKRSEKLGMESRFHHLEETTTEEVVKLVEELCEDPEVHGVLVQLPVAEGLDEGAIVEAVTPEKDVDGISPSFSSARSRFSRLVSTPSWSFSGATIWTPRGSTGLWLDPPTGWGNP
jgi:methylenetetrahydrofolate dehydrogenase (NADP+)/methenyltetrahydrofolate cyclohydrolase